jgi:hypothetical protein
LNSKRFIVTQADAHSWVEVYFPGIGWVPFEPTAGLPAIKRSEHSTPAVTPIPTIFTSPSTGTGMINLGKTASLAILASVFLMATAWITWVEVRLRRLKPIQAASEIYRRMKRYSLQMKVPLMGGETPLESCSMLEKQIENICYPGTLSNVGNRTIDQARALTNHIVRLSYRPVEAAPNTSQEIIRLWSRLRWQLRLIWAFQWVRTMLQQFQQITQTGIAGTSKKGTS